MPNIIYFIENKQDGPQISAEVLDVLYNNGVTLEEAFVCAVGNNVILCGVEETSPGVFSPGLIIMANELFHFTGGNYSPYLVVTEQTTECRFCNSDIHRIYTLKTVGFASETTPGDTHLAVSDEGLYPLIRITSMVSMYITIQTLNSTVSAIQDSVTDLETFVSNIDTYIANYYNSTLAPAWDAGFEVGEIIAVSSAKVPPYSSDYFDFSNPATKGIGKVGERYAKWAICNGKNGTMDFSGETLRGYKHGDAAHDYTVDGAGNDSVSLTTANIPKHRHRYVDSCIDIVSNDGVHARDALIDYCDSLDPGMSPTFTIHDAIPSSIWPFIREGGGTSRLFHFNIMNTGDGTSNRDDFDELPSSVTAVDIINKYKTIVFIQKITN